VLDLAKANRRGGPKRGARAEGHGQVETCKHHGPNRRDCRRRDPRSTQTHNPKRAAISRARRTLKGARLRYVERGAFDGARPRGRRIADHRIATSTSIGMGKPGFEPGSGDGRPCVIDLVERRENGIGEFGALSSKAGEEDDGFFVGDSGQRFNHAWRRLFDQTAFQETARLHASHYPQSARDGGCCLAIEIGKQFDQRRQISPPGRTQAQAAARTDGSACRRSGSATAGFSLTPSRDAAMTAAARFGPCTIPLAII
jgi:hypothetical protein